jgi:hypothetical protein
MTICQVVRILQNTPDQVATSRKRHLLLGKAVCQQAIRRLLQIGSDRCSRLRKCAQTGATAPLDGRRTKRASICKNKVSELKRATIVEYLTELFQQVSEPMPEANQSLHKMKTGEIAMLVTDSTEAAASSKDSASAKKKPMRFRRNRGRRPRLAGQVHRGACQSTIRLLPPGSYTDYLSMLRARHPTMNISLKLFLKAAWLRMMEALCKA